MTQNLFYKHVSCCEKHVTGYMKCCNANNNLTKTLYRRPFKQSPIGATTIWSHSMLPKLRRACFPQNGALYTWLRPSEVYLYRWPIAYRPYSSSVWSFHPTSTLGNISSPRHRLQQKFEVLSKVRRSFTLKSYRLLFTAVRERRWRQSRPLRGWSCGTEHGSEPRRWSSVFLSSAPLSGKFKYYMFFEKLL